MSTGYIYSITITVGHPGNFCRQTDDSHVYYESLQRFPIDLFLSMTVFNTFNKQYPIITNFYLIKGCRLRSQIVKRKMTYCGHIMRKYGECLKKETIRGTIPGMRRRGRPKTIWLSNIMDRAWSGTTASATDTHGERSFTVPPTLGPRTVKKKDDCGCRLMRVGHTPNVCVVGLGNSNATSQSPTLSSNLHGISNLSQQSRCSSTASRGRRRRRCRPGTPMHYSH